MAAQSVAIPVVSGLILIIALRCLHAVCWNGLTRDRRTKLIRTAETRLIRRRSMRSVTRRRFRLPLPDIVMIMGDGITSFGKENIGAAALYDKPHSFPC
jgi:hypothetical protein